MPVHMKIGRNDLCWCGSGQKFKKCHLSRESQSRVPFGVIRDRIRRHFRIEDCLHPGASETACGKLGNAHTIHRKGALAKIVDSSNHVLTFRYSPEPVIVPIRIGWKRASTFPGFCARHDNDLFFPIEDRPFVGSAEQCLLIGYRALCYEYYLKHAALSANREIAGIADRGLPSEHQREIQADLRAWAVGYAAAIEYLEIFKEQAETIIRERSFSDWGRLVIPFTGDLCIAFTGAPTPSFDMHGHQIQNLANPTTLTAPVFSGIVSTEDGGAFIMVWPPEWASQKFVDSFISIDRTNIPSAIAHFAFGHIENTFFSETWWNMLDESSQNTVASLAKVIFPEDEKGLLTNAKLVNWSIKDIIMERPVGKCQSRIE